MKIQKINAVTHLEKNDVLEASLFTPILPRYIIQRLSRVFGIDITDFYREPPSDFFKDEEGSD